MFGASFSHIPLISAPWRGARLFGASFSQSQTINQHITVCAIKETEMPFEKKGVFALEAVVNVRLTPAEKDQLREDAELAGLSLSELVRRRYFGRPIVANADIIMVREMRRIGGLLKHVHTSSGGAYTQQTADALSAVRSYIEKLAAT
jgi:hypothetical protein